ncbi:MAG: ribonuclease III, partial [Clostridia bacterium]|nr:ribonuclease III [Clostridia bacterium]
MKALEQNLGYSFKNKNLLINALCHSSYANEVRNGTSSNERLEFLGDSVLSVVVADYLYNNFKNLPEGELTKLRASLVCEKSLCSFSRELDIGEFLMLGKGEEKGGGRERDSILADAFEAVLAAMYLDGGMEIARKHVL